MYKARYSLRWFDKSRDKQQRLQWVEDVVLEPRSRSCKCASRDCTKRRKSYSTEQWTQSSLQVGQYLPRSDAVVVENEEGGKRRISFRQEQQIVGTRSKSASYRCLDLEMRISRWNKIRWHSEVEGSFLEDGSWTKAQKTYSSMERRPKSYCPS